MSRVGRLVLGLLGLVSGGAAMGQAPDLSTVPADLVVPPLTVAEPAAGRRVRQTLPAYVGTQVHHAVYLPTDWQPGRRWPVVCEYAGNGPYQNAYGDVSTGRLEDSRLGYGLTAGRGWIWVCLPYVNRAAGENQLQWWGDVEATCQYAIDTVRDVCEQFGGDPAAVVLAGFSRGAIGCGYLGLHDDAIADVWLAFFAYSHYDGVREWPYPASDAAAARERLRRLRGRASFIGQEGGTAATQRYLTESGVTAPFTFATTPFRNHHDGWTLRPSPVRDQARAWLAQVVREKPGTHAIRGWCAAEHGDPLPGLRVASGPTHWTLTDADGRFELAGLTDGDREVAVPGASVRVVLDGADVDGVELRPAGG